MKTNSEGNMAVSQWTIESDIQLINLVKKYDMFYNPKSCDYRNTTLKSDVWKRIGSILDKTDEDCSKRWFYVRAHYVKRRNKPVPKKISPVIRHGLKRAKLLKFLDQYRNLHSFTNDSSTDQSVNEPASSEMSYGNDNETDNDNDNDTDNGNDIVEVDYKNEIVDLEDEDFDNETSTEPDKKEVKDSEKANVTENFDETDHFFASMAKITKKLPRRDQVVLRMQISTMVGNAELKNMDGGK